MKGTGIHNPPDDSRGEGGRRGAGEAVSPLDRPRPVPMRAPPLQRKLLRPHAYFVGPVRN